MENGLKTLITGCAGFIGSHLTEVLLKEGNVVIGIDCLTDYYSKKLKERNLKFVLENDNFTYIEKNLLEIDLDEILRDVEYVFHQSAQPGVRTSWGENFKIYTDNNILATQKLLEASKDFDLKKIVYASSSSIYGDVPELPMKEDMIPRPISPYGVSKLAGEHLCYLYWKNYELPTISLRYFTVYGPRQRPDMAFNRFIKSILSGEQITIYGDGEQTRDFTYISDIVEANLLASKCNLNGELFNIGGGSRTTINRVVKLIEGLTGKKADIEYLERQRGDVRDTFADISEAEKILGYTPQVGIEEGLKRYLEWFQNQEHF